MLRHPRPFPALISGVVSVLLHFAVFAATFVMSPAPHAARPPGAVCFEFSPGDTSPLREVVEPRIRYDGEARRRLSG